MLSPLHGDSALDSVCPPATWDAGALPRQLGVKDAPVLAEGSFVKQKQVACCGGRAWPGPPGLGSIAKIVGAISRAPTACPAWPRDGVLITV